MQNKPRWVRWGIYAAALHFLGFVLGLVLMIGFGWGCTSGSCAPPIMTAVMYALYPFVMPVEWLRIAMGAHDTFLPTLILYHAFIFMLGAGAAIVWERHKPGADPQAD